MTRPIEPQPSASTVHVASLRLYPVKSTSGTQVPSLAIEPRGPRDDRRWLIVDAVGRFLTARKYPQLVLVRAEPLPGALRLSAPGFDTLTVPVPPADGERVRTIIWDDTVEALAIHPDADAWLSALLERPVRLVHMDAATRRPMNPAYAQPGDELSFADASPLMLLSQASVDSLNARLVAAGSAPVTMSHFRPNVVVDGVEAHAEDGWRHVRIGALTFDVAKPCIRCVFTTIDPTLGQRREDREPLETLKRYRDTPKGIAFGMHLIPRGTGVLHVGDPVVPD